MLLRKSLTKLNYSAGQVAQGKCLTSCTQDYNHKLLITKGGGGAKVLLCKITNNTERGVVIGYFAINNGREPIELNYGIWLVN